MVNSKISYSEELARCRQRLTCKRKEMSEMESCLNEDCCDCLCTDSKISYSEELARCRQRLTCKRKEMSEMESCLSEDCCDCLCGEQ